MNTPKFVAGGPPPTAADLNAIAALGDRSFTGGRGFHVSSDGVVDLVGPEEVWAKLTAAAGTGSNPYAWAEAKGTGTGGSSVVTGGRTGTDAYEANAVTGLGNKFVRLRYSEAGDWRFTIGSRQGNPCYPTICGHINECDGGCPMVGVTVTITGPGGFSASGITDGTGQYCVQVTGGAGIYTVSFPAHDHFQGGSATVTIPAGSCASYQVNWTRTGFGEPLLLDTGYQCCSCCKPISETLHLTFDGIPITLTYGASSQYPGWVGCHVFTSAPYVYPRGSCPPCEEIISYPPTNDIPVLFIWDCLTGLSWVYPTWFITCYAVDVNNNTYFIHKCRPRNASCDLPNLASWSDESYSASYPGYSCLSVPGSCSSNNGQEVGATCNPFMVSSKGDPTIFIPIVQTVELYGFIYTSVQLHNNWTITE